MSDVSCAEYSGGRHNESFFSWLSGALSLRRKSTVAVLRICGVIGKLPNKSGVTFEEFEKCIEKAFSVPKCKAVILLVNSPGGSPVQCEMIAEKILRLSEEKDIPVYSFAEDVAASAGYWILCSGSKVFASKNSVVGSIGVIAAGFGFTDAIKKLGIKRRVYCEGEHKSVLDPFLDEKPEDIEIIKHVQRRIHKHFKSYVKERRGMHIEPSDLDEVFSGKFWSGEDAFHIGLVDGIAVYSKFIHDEFGAKTKIVRIKQKNKFVLSKLLSFLDEFGLQGCSVFPDIRL